MSSPNTDPSTEEERHKPALTGIRASMIAGGVLILALLFWLAWQGNTPDDPETRIDGRTGEEVE